jgi:cyclopropane-fatty-acyl-phospholipid synthase
MEHAFELADALYAQTGAWMRNLSIMGMLRRLPDFRKQDSAEPHSARLPGTKNSPGRDREAIRFHYDVSNDFYKLWLDRRMVYSCAYFEEPDASLEAAQLGKLDLICRKLDLRPGERLLDVGCGWGGLLIHAATHYGVKADGITLSERQAEWARNLIESHGLEDRVTVRLVDYRDLKADEIYDKVVSVGMVEHVGLRNLDLYFQRIFDVLKPGGLFLNHGIGQGPRAWINEKDNFIERYVFPDSDLQPISKMLAAAESSGWEIRDVDSLREHYALTLRHWVRRLDAHHAEAVEEVDEASFRTWKLYMAGSAHSFDHGFLSIYQTLLAKLTPDGDSQAPMTRRKWYAPSETEMQGDGMGVEHQAFHGINGLSDGRGVS